MREVLLRRWLPLRNGDRSASDGTSASSGFTLVETLVTVLIMVVVLAAIQRVLFAGFTTFMFGQDNFEAQGKVEQAHKYLDRSLRESRSVIAADPKGTYVAVTTDADNDGTDELALYYVDYDTTQLLEYTDEPYDPDTTYSFSNPDLDTNLQKSEVITDIVGTKPTDDQKADLSPNPSHSGRPFIFFGDDPHLSLEYSAGWESEIKALRTYFHVDVSPSSGADAYSLQTYIRFRNIQ